MTNTKVVSSLKKQINGYTLGHLKELKEDWTRVRRNHIGNLGDYENGIKKEKAEIKFCELYLREIDKAIAKKKR